MVMWNNILLILPVAAPVVFGLLAGCVKNRNARNTLTGTALIVNALFVLLAVLRGAQELTLWQLTDTVSIYFHVDGVSKLFLLIAAVGYLLAGVYAFRYLKEGHERFFRFFLLSQAALVGMCFAENLVTM